MSSFEIRAGVGNLWFRNEAIRLVPLNSGTGLKELYVPGLAELLKIRQARVIRVLQISVSGLRGIVHQPRRGDHGSPRKGSRSPHTGGIRRDLILRCGVQG
ncbi:hypothetical protein J1614_001443 [Plenodomus biglobosus]|nr:hypothetical protein J1614_001443 [Plenodomus biglobosus]